MCQTVVPMRQGEHLARCRKDCTVRTLLPRLEPDEARSFVGKQRGCVLAAGNVKGDQFVSHGWLQVREGHAKRSYSGPPLRRDDLEPVADRWRVPGFESFEIPGVERIIGH
jgi:hypothetical protein